MSASKINMRRIATRLIGKEDADVWWRRHEALFIHPLFITDRILPKHLLLQKDAVWAHPHPDLKSSFGVYIVRRGTTILYVGRSEERVSEYLGILSKL